MSSKLLGYPNVRFGSRRAARTSDAMTFRDMKKSRDAAQGISDQQFLSIAERIGMALNKDRPREDQLRRAGMSEEANKIYYRNKEEAGSLLRQSGMTGSEFDKRLAKLGGGRRINVKLARLFP